MKWQQCQMRLIIFDFCRALEEEDNRLLRSSRQSDQEMIFQNYRRYAEVFIVLISTVNLETWFAITNKIFYDN